MEYILILGISISFFVLLGILFELRVKEIKTIGENQKLNELANHFPENKEVCVNMLKMLKNDQVQIKEEEDSKTNLYLIYNNSILIGNIKDTYTRIQTIAHECIHSVQSKKLLWFNFIFTNLYLFFFIAMIFLTLFRRITNPILMICLFLFFSMIQYGIRSFLETDAMEKTPYLAKEYMEKYKITSQETIEEIVGEYEKLNKMGIKMVLYDLLLKNEMKLIAYLIICIFIYGV